MFGARAILRNATSSRQQHPAGVPGAPPGGATTPSSVAKSTDLTVATRSDEETAAEERESARQAHAARAHRGGASPGGMSATADTMPMPAEAARAPITDFCPAARSCAAPRSSRAQLKARRRAGGAGATELVQQWAQRSKRSPRGPCRRVSSPANVPPRRAQPRRACPFSRCAPGAAGAGRSRSSAPAPLWTLLGGVARAAAENAYTSGRAAWLTWM